MLWHAVCQQLLSPLTKEKQKQHRLWNIHPPELPAYKGMRYPRGTDMLYIYGIDKQQKNILFNIKWLNKIKRNMLKSKSHFWKAPRFLGICPHEVHGKYKEPGVCRCLLTTASLQQDGMSLHTTVSGGRQVTKEICGPFSVQSQSDSPSTEYGNLRACLPRSRTAAQGLRAKPRKAEERLASTICDTELWE